MSVFNLSTNIVNVYAVTNSQNEYGTNIETYSLKYTGIRASIQYIGGQERIDNGKEKTITDNIIFIHKKYSIDESDLIVDVANGYNYDITAIKRLYSNTHIQVYAKYVNPIVVYEEFSSSSSSIDSSSSSSIGYSSSSSSSSNSSSSSSIEYSSSSSSSSVEYSSSSSSSNDVDLGLGLLLHYKMNDNAANTTVVDNINGMNGTSIRNTSAISVSGKINNALTFNGSTDKVTTGQIYSASHDYTISMWFYILKMNGINNAFLNSGSPNTFCATAGLQLAPSYASGRINYGGPCKTRYMSDQNDVLLGLWQHIVITCTSSRMVQVYLNLLSCSSTGAQQLQSGTDILNNFVLGAGGWTDRWFNGYIDDVRIYNRVINFREREALYNNGNGTERDDMDSSSSSI